MCGMCGRGRYTGYWVDALEAAARQRAIDELLADEDREAKAQGSKAKAQGSKANAQSSKANAQGSKGKAKAKGSRK